jgi:hypothetical protein
MATERVIMQARRGADLARDLSLVVVSFGRRVLW